MGLSLSVFSAYDHSAGLSLIAYLIETIGNFLHDPWARLGKILADGPGRNAGAQRLDDMSGFFVIHPSPPPSLRSGSAAGSPQRQSGPSEQSLLPPAWKEAGRGNFPAAWKSFPRWRQLPRACIPGPPDGPDPPYR